SRVKLPTPWPGPSGAGAPLRTRGPRSRAGQPIRKTRAARRIDMGVILTVRKGERSIPVEVGTGRGETPPHQYRGDGHSSGAACRTRCRVAPARRLLPEEVAHLAGRRGRGRGMRFTR